jgi:2-polyprenyl-3-methyl-5-hydroxy-6-metoxy-1,4-benzoquinol methylase
MGSENTSPATYVLGHTPAELERLAAQARLYDPFTEQFFHEAGVDAGMQVLDVGCGSGEVSFLLARLVGSGGRVVGIDNASTAVETARHRAQEQRIANVRFLVADVAELAVDDHFDAAVGRFVLQFVPDPAEALRGVGRHVRPGGTIAFQEVDWSGCRALPALPTFGRCLEWGVQALQLSGANPFMGMQLAAAFIAAGLPAPALSLRAGIGSGPHHPIYSSIAGLMRTLQPKMESLDVASAAEVDADTLASRISEEAVAANATVVWVSLIGAAARTADTRA